MCMFYELRFFVLHLCLHIIAFTLRLLYVYALIICITMTHISSAVFSIIACEPHFEIISVLSPIGTNKNTVEVGFRNVSSHYMLHNNSEIFLIM